MHYANPLLLTFYRIQYIFQLFWCSSKIASKSTLRKKQSLENKSKGAGMIRHEPLGCGVVCCCALRAHAALNSSHSFWHLDRSLLCFSRHFFNAVESHASTLTASMTWMRFRSIMMPLRKLSICSCVVIGYFDGKSLWEVRESSKQLHFFNNINICLLQNPHRLESNKDESDLLHQTSTMTIIII